MTALKILERTVYNIRIALWRRLYARFIRETARWPIRYRVVCLAFGTGKPMSFVHDALFDIGNHNDKF